MGRRSPPIRDYEIMIIVDPTLSDTDIETIQERLRDLAVSRGAEVKKLAVCDPAPSPLPIVMCKSVGSSLNRRKCPDRVRTPLRNAAA